MRAIVAVILLLVCGACGLFGARAEEHIDVFFVGNEKLSDSELEDALVRFQKDYAKSTHKKSAVDDAAWDLERYYQSLGFSDVRVDYRYAEPPSSRPRAVLFIREGPRTELVDVGFEGNASFPDKELAQFFERESTALFEDSTRWYRKSDIDSAAQDVVDFYLGKGYLDVVVHPPVIEFNATKTEANARVVIEEGIRFRVASIEVEGGDPRFDPKSIEAVKAAYVGKPYHERLSVEIQGKIEEAYADQGFADARVERVQRLTVSDGSIALGFRVTAGPRVTIGEVRVSGNEATKESFIRDRLALQTGETYSRQEERTSFARMFKSGVFDRVSIQARKAEGEDQNAESVVRPVDVVVEEGRAIETYVEPGYGSYERLRLSVGARHKNVFGTGRILDGKGAISEKSLSGTLSLIDPWLFGGDLISNLTVFGSEREEPSFEKLENGAGISLNQRFSSRFEGLVGYQYRRSDIANVDLSATLDPEETENVDISEVLSSVAYDTRDNVFHPEKGMFAKLGGEVGTAAIGSELEFFRIKAQDAVFFALTGSTVLGASAQGGVIVPFGTSEVIPIQERFYNGGENSVRSFRESELGPKDQNGEPTGGEAFTTFSIELRQRLRGRLEGALFYDLGNVTDQYEDFFDFEGYSSAIGIGLRYALPVGPIRIDAGFNPDPHDGESTIVVHFALGTAF